MGRMDHEEIFTNILLDVRNPERFLFLSGHSASGNQQFVPETKSFETTPEHISSNFGLQELTGITLLICHDIANLQQKFVDLLRRLVSSGESQHVQRKFERAAIMRFEGIVALAANKNPFTHQQREGRRRVCVHVPEVPQEFDALFPASEFASFAVQQDVTLIVDFIRSVNKDVLVKQVMLESFKDNPKALHLQDFISRHTEFCDAAWVPLGASGETQNASSLYGWYLKYTFEQGVKNSDILSYAFSESFISAMAGYLYCGQKVLGILTQDLPEKSEISSLNLDPFRAAPFWVHTRKCPAADKLRTSTVCPPESAVCPQGQVSSSGQGTSAVCPPDLGRQKEGL